ncbi:MAG: AAA family ATPase [Chloroflexi bacterium]|nr:AAA family ATPase [Chloroflexota bacterium]
MQGERRIVTMLFCDVKGSTAAAEQLDPEEWAEIMNGAFEYLITPVYRYEGTLARLMGDAILAFFGAPIAHEDDAQRATLAGLDILQDIEPYCAEVKRRWGLDFSVRVGVNTGLVVVGEVGTDMRLEYTAMGDAVNLAARMEQTAEPGTIQLTEDTYKLIAPLFEFEDLGAMEVKGKSQPVQSYRVLGRKVEPGRLRGIEGLNSPLVGRDPEMNKLRAALDNLRKGRGQIVSVMGEAGLGKSRLVAEFRNTLAADGLLPTEEAALRGRTNGATEATIGWHEGRSLSYQTSTPYAPFADMFGRLFGLQEKHSDEEQYDLVKANVAELLPDRADEIAPYIASVLGIKLTGEALELVKYLQPPQLRERILLAVQDLFEQMASLQPLVILFEDLHWVDPTSLDLLERLVPLTDRASIMIIGLFRPVRQEPSWRFHELASRDYIHRYTEVTLDPLDQEGSRELVSNLLEVEDLPEKVRTLIMAKAEGNPFFVEEVIRSLLDAKLVVRENSHWRATREIENIAVPDTLAGVINARLDSIDDESRRVAQAASVIGREFHFEELLALHKERERVEEALSDLQRRELIREKSRIPHRVYMFKHVVTQETAYASLLLSRRRELHRQVAEFLEERDAERVTDIARHLLEAQEEARALPYLVNAADHAAFTYSTPEAIGFYKRAMQILETQHDLQLKRRTYEGLGGALALSFDVQGATENYQEMYEFGKTHGDFPIQVSALNKLGFVSGLMQGQVQEAHQHLGDAQRLARESQDLPGLAECHMNYCYLLTSTGDFDDAVGHLSESAEIGRTLNLEEPRLFGLTHTANTLTYMTRFDEAWEKAQEARQLAGEMKNQKWLAELSVVAISLYHLRNGDLDEAGQSAEEGMTLAGRIGAADNESQGAYMLGQLAWMRGEYERSIAYQQQALGAARVAGYPYLQASALSALGTVYLSISEKLLPQTAEYHTQALELLEMPLGAAMGGANWADIGFCAMTAGNVTSAGDLFQKGLTISTATKNLVRPQLLVGSAFVALSQGQIDNAKRLVQEARGFAEERHMKHFYPLLALAEGQISTTDGEMEAALESFSRAEALALEMCMRPLVVQARIGAGQILSATGRTSELEEKRHKSQQMIDEIADLFQDDKLRAMYIESAAEKLP